MQQFRCYLLFAFAYSDACNVQSNRLWNDVPECHSPPHSPSLPTSSSWLPSALWLAHWLAYHFVAQLATITNSRIRIHSTFLSILQIYLGGSVKSHNWKAIKTKLLVGNISIESSVGRYFHWRIVNFDDLEPTCLLSKWFKRCWLTVWILACWQLIPKKTNFNLQVDDNTRIIRIFFKFTWPRKWSMSIEMVDHSNHSLRWWMPKCSTY